MYVSSWALLCCVVPLAAGAIAAGKLVLVETLLEGIAGAGGCIPGAGGGILGADGGILGAGGGILGGGGCIPGASGCIPGVGGCIPDTGGRAGPSGAVGMLNPSIFGTAGTEPEKLLENVVAVVTGPNEE